MKKFLCVVCIILIGIITGFNTSVSKKVEIGVKLKMLLVNIPHSTRFSLSVAINPKGIENKYGKPDLTKIYGKKTYEIRNISDDSKLIVVYTDNRVIDMWQLKKLFSKVDFKNIIPKKSTLEDVMKIDPYSTIVGTNKMSITEHKLKNNGVVLITYSKEVSSSKETNGWTVKNLEFLKNDPSNFVKDGRLDTLLIK